MPIKPIHALRPRLDPASGDLVMPSGLHRLHDIELCGRIMISGGENKFGKWWSWPFTAFVWRDEGKHLNWWAGTDLEGVGHGHLKVFSWHFLRRNQENHKKAVQRGQ